jgi:hypothetical protein
MMSLQSPESLPLGNQITGEQGVTGLWYPNVREALARIVNPKSDPSATPFSPGGLGVFYCPSNFFCDGDTSG